jgi:hypothetical protein
MFTRILGRARGVEVGIIALSLGERVERVRRFHPAHAGRGPGEGFLSARASRTTELGHSAREYL